MWGKCRSLGNESPKGRKASYLPPWGPRKSDPTALKRGSCPSCYVHSMSSHHFYFSWWLVWEAKTLGLTDFIICAFSHLTALSLNFMAWLASGFATFYLNSYDPSSLILILSVLCLPPLASCYQSCLLASCSAVDLFHLSLSSFSFPYWRCKCFLLIWWCQLIWTAGLF